MVKIRLKRFGAAKRPCYRVVVQDSQKPRDGVCIEEIGTFQPIAAEKMTMVVVTHEMAFARDISSHIIFMDGGVIVEEGAPDDVINHPKQERTKAFLARFNS